MDNLTDMAYHMAHVNTGGDPHMVAALEAALRALSGLESRMAALEQAARRLDLDACIRRTDEAFAGFRRVE